MDTVLFFGLAAVYAALLAWGVALVKRHGLGTSANLYLITVAGLLYDNLVLASGRFLGTGPLLETLSYGRFILHAIYMPLLVVWAWHAARRVGMPWARRDRTRAGVIGVALALVAFELVTQVAGLNLEAESRQGALRYADAVPTQGPPLMVLIVAAAVIAAGVVLWRRRRWPWLMAGAVVFAVGWMVATGFGSDVGTNVFELVMVVSIVVTKAHQDGNRLGAEES